MLLLQPRIKLSTYLQGFMLAIMVNLLLVSFIYLLVLNHSTLNTQPQVQLDFRQFRSEQEKRPQEQPVELAQTVQKPALNQLARPKLNIAVRNINPVQALALPAMMADEFSIDPSVLSFEPTRFTAEHDMTAQVSSGLIAATPVFQLPPQYPPRAKQMEIEGEVTMHLYLESDGKVSDIKIISEKPVGIFAQSAMQSAYRWRFQPPGKGHSPWQTLRISYELK